MARTWYNLAAGPAPWADATSYTSSTLVTNTGFYGVTGYSSYRTDLEQGVTFSTSQTSRSPVSTDVTIGGSYRSEAGTGAGLRTASLTISETLNSPVPDFTVTRSGSTSSSYSEAYLSANLMAYTIAYESRTAGGTSAGTDAPVTASGGTTYSQTGANLLAYGTRAVVTTYIASTQASGYYLTTVNSYDSDYDSPSYVIISTALTSGTSTDTSTYASTTQQTETYTFLTKTYSTRVGELMVAQTTSYIQGAFHEIPIISALSGEVLRIVTATGSASVSGLDEIAGATFTRTTLNSAFSTTAGGKPFASTSATVTISTPVMSYGTATITVSAATYLTVTQQYFDGWIGGTQTQERYLGGATTTTLAQRKGVIGFTTNSNTGGGWPYTTHTVLLGTSLLSDTISGIDSAGGSAVYNVVTPYTYLQWISYLQYTGIPGQSITAKKSPIQLFVAEGGGGVGLTRLEREGGFQAPGVIGSTGGQGTGLSANSTFYIGVGNTALASPDDIYAPALMTASTAANLDSSYSFSLGSTACSVTESRTAQSTTTIGTVTNTYSTATVTQFTATITLAAQANSFISAGNDFSPSGAVVVGGPHAWTGGQQNVTLNGFGWRYTLGDGVGTTSYKETHLTSVATAALGASIIAAESFRAGVPSPALSAGLPAVHTFAFSAT